MEFPNITWGYTENLQNRIQGSINPENQEINIHCDKLVVYVYQTGDNEKYPRHVGWICSLNIYKMVFTSHSSLSGQRSLSRCGWTQHFSVPLPCPPFHSSRTGCSSPCPRPHYLGHHHCPGNASGWTLPRHTYCLCHRVIWVKWSQ